MGRKEKLFDATAYPRGLVDVDATIEELYHHVELIPHRRDVNARIAKLKGSSIES